MKKCAKNVKDNFDSFYFNNITWLSLFKMDKVIRIIQTNSPI